MGRHYYFVLFCGKGNVFFKQKLTRNLFNPHQFPIKFGRLFYLFIFTKTSFGIVALSTNISFSMCFVYMGENLYCSDRNIYVGPVLCINFQHFFYLCNHFCGSKLDNVQKIKKGVFCPGQIEGVSVKLMATKLPGLAGQQLQTNKDIKGLSLGKILT